jgi:hypothetical protein
MHLNDGPESVEITRSRERLGNVAYPEEFV